MSQFHRNNPDATPEDHLAWAYHAVHGRPRPKQKPAAPVEKPVAAPLTQPLT